MSCIRYLHGLINERGISAQKAHSNLLPPVNNILGKSEDGQPERRVGQLSHANPGCCLAGNQ
jgi:hypothetical protein